MNRTFWLSVLALALVACEPPEDLEEGDPSISEFLDPPEVEIQPTLPSGAEREDEEETLLSPQDPLDEEEQDPLYDDEVIFDAEPVVDGDLGPAPGEGLETEALGARAEEQDLPLLTAPGYEGDPFLAAEAEEDAALENLPRWRSNRETAQSPEPGLSAVFDRVDRQTEWSFYEDNIWRVRTICFVDGEPRAQAEIEVEIAWWTFTDQIESFIVIQGGQASQSFLVESESGDLEEQSCAISAIRGATFFISYTDQNEILVLKYSLVLPSASMALAEEAIVLVLFPVD